MKARTILILVGSPRRDGNSSRLASAALDGALAAGHDAEIQFIDDYVTSFLRDCRRCRKANGDCSIDDRFQELFLDKYLPADGILFATPLYWYGMSGQLKTFLDRTFCYYAASCTEGAAHARAMAEKRLGLLVSSEESYPSATIGLVHSIQEFARYNQCEFAGLVHGIGNRRGDVELDPGNPLEMAERLGADLFDKHFSDYRMTSERSGSVWNRSPRD
ncbi:MAG: flavodoxin family protein [Verrucomicrobiota bacterium]